MDADLRQRMLAYYDERAPEYDEAYTLGTGTASISDPEVFKAEARVLSGIVGQVAHGRIMDLACGTAYWLSDYAANCSHITLFDQSARPNLYDTVLVGFLLSHLTEAQEPFLFDAVRTMLAPSGRCLILDSAWSTERARFNAKEERQPRRLNDGTAFEIYKRYCDQRDIARWAKDYDVKLDIEHFGYVAAAALTDPLEPSDPPLPDVQPDDSRHAV